MYPIFLLRIRQKILTSSKFLHQIFTFFAYFLQYFVQVSSSIIRFPLLSSVVGECSNMETLVQKNNKPPTVSNLIEQAISQLDNHLFVLLGHKVTIRNYVHLVFTFLSVPHSISSPIFFTTVLTFDFPFRLRAGIILKKWEKKLTGTLQMFQK